MNKMLLPRTRHGVLFVRILILLEVGAGSAASDWRSTPRRAGRDWHGRGRGFALVDCSSPLPSRRASRFERPPGSDIQETNAIGTAWLRLDLLPADASTGDSGKFPAVCRFPAGGLP